MLVHLKMPRRQTEALLDEGLYGRAPLVGYKTFFGTEQGGGGGGGWKILLGNGFKHLNEIVVPKKSLSDQMPWRLMLHWNTKKSVWMVEVKRAKGEERGTEMLICRFSSQPVSTQAGLAMSTEWRFWSNNLWDVATATLAGKVPPKKSKKKTIC